MRGPLVASLILTLLAAACGGGPSASPSTQVTSLMPPAANDFAFQYPGPQVFTVDEPALSDVPTLDCTGHNRILVSSPLPPGLAIDANTGVISGTPTAITAAASYTISVFNEVCGTAQVSLVIEVNDGPFFYSSPAILAAGSAMTPLRPRGASGTASYTVTPPLPSGLAIDPATGVISGAPTSAQPPTYYQVSRAEALLTMAYGLTLGVGANSQGPIAVSNVSTLSCAYSGGFIGTYVGNSQANDEGLISIAFTPDGIALAHVLDVSGNAIYVSDGQTGLNASLDGSFDIDFYPPASGSTAPQIHGNFSGADLISGTFESGGIAKPFIASRLGGSAAAEIRYTGGSGGLGESFRIEVGVLDVTGTGGVGIVYQFRGVGLLNQQLAIQGTFSGNTFTWSLANEGEESVATESGTGLGLQFGDDSYDVPAPEKMSGCRLN
jgi:Putative Ig domain